MSATLATIPYAPLAATAAMATACAALSVFVVARRWALIGEGISHSGFGGAGFAWLLILLVPALRDVSWVPYLAVVIFCLGAALAIGYINRGSRVAGDAAIGIFLVASLAFGFLARDIYHHFRHEDPVDFSALLTGDLGVVQPRTALLAVIVSAAVLVTLVALGKEILSYCFDPLMAEAGGVRAGFIHYLLMILLAVTIIIGLPVIGAPLVTALLVLPGVTATLLSQRLQTVLKIAIAAALIGAILGVAVHTMWRFVPIGPAVVLILFLEFLAAYVAETLAITMTHDRAHVRLLQNAHADYIESQYRGMEQLPGNPQGVIIRAIGPTRTFIARGSRLENRALFTGEESDEQIANVLRHFADNGANCVIEVNPANFYVNPPTAWEKRLLKRLLELGCIIHDFRCVWSRTGEGEAPAEPRLSPASASARQEPRPPGVHRCERFEADTIDQYIALARRIDPKTEWTEDRIAAMSGPGWRHYVLFDQHNVPASNGSLFVKGPSAYLAWWYTNPLHRGRGMQQEGIIHRVRDAFQMGCERAFTVTDFNFTSPANLQRCGFSLAYNYLLVRRDPVPLA